MVLAAKKPAAAANAQVADILEAIKSTTTAVKAADVVVSAKKTAAAAKKPKAAAIPRGIAKSGRPWKDVKQKYVYKNRSGRLCYKFD